MGTKDDITKATLCEYFNDTLIKNQDVLSHIENLFTNELKRPLKEVHKQQAMVLSNAKVLHNTYGTAPGMYIQEKGKVYISMPGVPYEMMGLMDNEVLPLLCKDFERPSIYHRTILTQGEGESAI